MSCPRLGSRGLRRLTFSLLLILLIGGCCLTPFALPLFSVFIAPGHAGKHRATIRKRVPAKDFTLAVAKLAVTKIRPEHLDVQSV